MNRFQPLVFLIASAVSLSAFAAQAKPAKPAAERKNNAIQATPPEKIHTLKDFKVELIHTVPAETEGSWVSMCVDGKGRLIVCDQYGGLFRVTPPAVNSSPNETKVEKIPAKIGAANGLLWAFDSLYVVVNDYQNYRNNGVYRVTSSKNDDVLDDVKLMKSLAGPGGAGDHGPHAAVLSPDGQSIFIVVGNKSPLAEITGSKIAQRFGEDHLLPRMPDGRGFMRDKMAPGGNIYKMSPDGKSFELYATGFRNEYDAGFNKDGELFAYDADMEYDFNTSWYRPTRICHVISGAEFGWRNGAGKWPEWYEDSFGPVINIGPGSPTGVTFGYGAKFPAKYQNAMFACDWSWGKLYAIHLKPNGATYTAEKEEFLNGSPLPLTDIVIRPQDGAMYFTIGGRKVQSGLYRVTYTGGESTAPAVHNPGTPEQVAARELRHKLEAFHGRTEWTEVQAISAMESVWRQLGNEDRAIRSAARTALEQIPLKHWKAQALAEKDPAKGIPALLALVRVTGEDPFHRTQGYTEDKALQSEILKSLQAIDFTKLQDWQKLAMVRTYAVCFVRMGQPTEAQKVEILSRLDPQFPAKTLPLNYDLCMLLVYLQDPQIAGKAVPMLSSAATQEEQIEYGRSLRMLKAGWTPELRKQQFEWLGRAVNYRGGASFGAFIEMIRNDSIATLTPAEKEQLKPFLENPPKKTSPLEALSAALQGRERHTWTVDQLAPKAEQAMKGRNFERGRKMFGMVGCFACHRFANEGGMVGPDLSAVGSRFGVRDILVSIIEPSKEINEQFTATVVKTTDGDQVVGRIVNLNGDRVMVNTDLFDPNQQTAVDRNKVKSIETSKISLMPEGLLDYLKEDEVEDLLAYLISGGNPQHEAFK
jgi:putative heme-binding domain-containing protein